MQLRVQSPDFRRAGGRFAQSPAAATGTEVACANSRTVAMPPLCSVLRYAHCELAGGLPPGVGFRIGIWAAWNRDPTAARDDTIDITRSLVRPHRHLAPELSH
jgi:hypothetical protein